MLPSCLVLLAALAGSCTANVEAIQSDVLQQVVSQAQALALYSWENGTLARAITELYVESASPFGGSIPPPSDASNDMLKAIAQDAMLNKLADYSPATFRTNWSSYPEYSADLAFMRDGAAGDPPSLLEVVLWAAATGVPGLSGKTSQTFENSSSPILFRTAVEEQVFYTTQVVNRTSDGAISHRVSQVQIWADSVYMVPPALAYWGVVTGNASYIKEAVEQIRLYRNYLKSDSGLWRHIQLGTGTDDGHWSTGNAWASAGMLRVMAIISGSSMASDFSSEIESLKTWSQEIMTAIAPLQTRSGLYWNYADDNKTEASSTFLDASASALLAAVGYRMSAMKISDSYVHASERTYANITAFLSASSDKIVRPTVDPMDWGRSSNESAEAQSFVILMEAGRRAWLKAGGQDTVKDDTSSVGNSAKGSASRLELTSSAGLAALVLLSTALMSLF